MVVTSAEGHADGQQEAQPVVAVLVVGFILTLAIPLMVDAVQNRGRNRRKKAASAVDPHRDASQRSVVQRFRSSQLTPTVSPGGEQINRSQRADTNGKVEAETAPIVR
jgi:hypothetical protein